MFWPVLLFLLFNLLFLPLQFAALSIVGLLTVPGQIYGIATNPRLRRNHALEHATINVIEERYGRRMLTGLARNNGFVVWGAVDPFVVEEAARTGLTRLKRGETWLAIHDRCGTSIATANLISSIAFLALLFQLGYLSPLSVLVAMAVASMVGPIVGRYVQQYFTTSADVADFEIGGVEGSHEFISFFGLAVPVPAGELFVRTYASGR